MEKEMDAGPEVEQTVRDAVEKLGLKATEVREEPQLRARPSLARRVL